MATSLVKKLTTAVDQQHEEDQAQADRHLDAADADVERHLVLARRAVLEAQHDHRQRLEDEAPDDAEGVGLAQQR